MNIIPRHRGKKSFLVSYDVFTRSRSFANEEVQNDKCFLGELCYFKVLKRQNKDMVCISVKWIKKSKSLCMYNNWIIE